MATKLDITRPLFLGPKAVRENTTVDHIRRAVVALDKGEGVTYPQLEEYLLQNYSPAKSQGYGSAFIKSYVRDAVKDNYQYLSYDNAGHEYATLAGAAPKAGKAPKAAAAAKPKKLSKARKEQLEVLTFIRDAGEVADAGDVDNTQITPEDIASETGKKAKAVGTKVAALEKEGLLRTETVDGNDDAKVTYVYLTAAGLAAANEVDPAGASSSPGAETGAPEPESEAA